MASLNQAEAAAQSARINYEFCTIKAPVSGYLSRINYRLGSLIGPTGAQPLTVLSDIHQVNVYFSMSESDFLQFQNKYPGITIQEKIKNSEMVGLTIADGNSFEQKGKIDAIEGQFNSNTGSVTFRAKFDNPKSILRAGNTGKIIIDQNYDAVTLIPIASTMNIQDKTYVLAKNAILIVEFAIQRRRAGKSLTASAVEGTKARLRPILMTSLAFIAGLMPLLFATGPSAIGNHSIGYAAVFGMLFGTVLGVFITPVLFVVFQYLQEKLRGKPLDESVWDYEPSKLKKAH